MEYTIQKRVVKPSQPIAGGFSKQVVRWDVVTSDGKVIRSFKRHDKAVKEIVNRKGRKAQLTKAREEAMETQQPVVVRRRGQQPITVSYLT